MSDLNVIKRAILDGCEFPSAQNKPIVMTVSEASQIDVDYYRLYAVSWWGESPKIVIAGFTPCRIAGIVPDGEYRLVLMEDFEYESKESEYLVEPDELVLVFYGQLPD